LCGHRILPGINYDWPMIAAEASAADLKFLQDLQWTREGTSNRKAALES
jgi:hypothetical protein